MIKKGDVVEVSTPTRHRRWLVGLIMYRKFDDLPLARLIALDANSNLIGELCVEPVHRLTKVDNVIVTLV